MECSFENGLFYNWQYNTRNVLIARLQQHVKTHQSLEEYIGEFSNTGSTSSITLENFKMVFVRFFGLLAIFSLLFIVRKVRLVSRLRRVLIRAARQVRRLVRRLMRRMYARRLNLFRFRVRIRISRVSVVHVPELGSIE